MKELKVTPVETASHVEAVISLTVEYDCTHHLMFYRDDDGSLKVAALCSDCFWWGCADCEEITPDNINVYKQTLEDCEALPEAAHEFPVIYANELFAARVRKMRPQGASYPHYPVALWPLFDACGPERECDGGNPKKRPTEELTDPRAPRAPTREELESQLTQARAELEPLLKRLMATTIHEAMLQLDDHFAADARLAQNLRDHIEEITRLRSELKQAQRINSDFQVWLDHLANGELDAQSTKDAEMRAENAEVELGKAQEEIQRLSKNSGA